MVAIPNAYAFRMPSGIAGAVNREWAHIGEPNQLDSSTPPTAFGDPVKMGTNGRIQALAAGDAATAIYGFLERPFPGQSGTSYGPTVQALGQSYAPAAGARCTVMKAGYMSVVLQNTTAAAKGGAVYVRLVTPPSGGRVDGLEAAADSTSGNTILVANAYFMGAADASGNTEIAYNL